MTTTDRPTGCCRRWATTNPTGWRGTVALSMEEDSSGECPPLSAEVRATLDELAAG